MTYLLGYRVKLEPRRLGWLRTFWYRLKATILRRMVSVQEVISIEVHVNGEPIIHGSLEMCVIPGGLEVLYPQPFLVRDTDRVELKTYNLSETAMAKVDLIMAEPEDLDLR